VRLPHVGVLLAWHFFALRVFGVEVTPIAALLYLPAYFAVAAIPGLSVNGIGFPQLVALEFFARFAHVPPGTTDVAGAQKAAVIAYSLGTSGVSIFLQLVIGLACLRRGIALGLATSSEKAAPPTDEPPDDDAAARTAMSS
jgi:hypothetical protein